MQSPILAAEEAANLSVPDDTYVAGLLRTVDVAVSSVFAVRYVPPYSMKMSATGREKSIARGRENSVRKEVLRLSASVLRPDAFSMMDLLAEACQSRHAVLRDVGGHRANSACSTNLSIIDMKGAIMDAAHAALTASAPSRKPRFLVFHCWDRSERISMACCLIGTGTRGFASSVSPGAGVVSPCSFMVHFRSRSGRLKTVPRLPLSIKNDKNEGGKRRRRLATTLDSAPILSVTISHVEKHILQPAIHCPWTYSLCLSPGDDGLPVEVIPRAVIERNGKVVSRVRNGVISCWSQARDAWRICIRVYRAVLQSDH